MKKYWRISHSQPARWNTLLWTAINKWQMMENEVIHAYKPPHSMRNPTISEASVLAGNFCCGLFLQSSNIPFPTLLHTPTHTQLNPC